MEKKKRDNGNKGFKKSDETKQKIAKAMLGNLNAEQYTEEQTINLITQMITMSQNDDYTFIKQITRQFGISYDVLMHLIKRFPILNEAYKLIKDNLETNCYTASNQDKLKMSLAVLNLKSNYGWTDRVASNTDITTGGEAFNIKDLIQFKSTSTSDNN